MPFPVQPGSDGFPGTRPVFCFMSHLSRAFFPLISVIKARSCRSSRSNRRSSIPAPPRNSHLPPLPCLPLLMLSGAALQLGGGTCEGNTRPGAGLSRFPGIRWCGAAAAEPGAEGWRQGSVPSLPGGARGGRAVSLQRRERRGRRGAPLDGEAAIPRIGRCRAG